MRVEGPLQTILRFVPKILDSSNVQGIFLGIEVRAASETDVVTIKEFMF